MNIEENIELAVQDIIQARTYISTNSIPVVRFRDRLTSKGDKFITVHVQPHERLSPNHDLYRMHLRLLADTKSQEDLRSNSLDALIAENSDELNETMTTATLQTAIDAVDATSGITVQGIVQTPGADTDGEYQIVSAEADIFITYTKPA